MTYKYIKEDIVNNFLEIFFKFFPKRDKDLTSLKKEILSKCPNQCFNNIYKKNYTGYRIVIVYDKEGVKYTFYPHLANTLEVKESINRLIEDIKKKDPDILRLINLMKSHKNSKISNPITKLICNYFCKWLSVSLFLNLEEAKKVAIRLKVHKNVKGIRKGLIELKYGPSYNFNPRSSHIDWYPYDWVNEWNIFNEEIQLE